MVWTIGRVWNCLDVHLGQIVCDKDGVWDWWIVLVEMPLTQFEECWPLPTESLLELPWNLSIVTLTLTLCPINCGVLTSHNSHHPSKTPCLSWISYATQKLIHARWSKSSLKHSTRFCRIIFSEFKIEFYCISFFLMSRLHFWNSPAVTIRL